MKNNTTQRQSRKAPRSKEVGAKNKSAKHKSQKRPVKAISALNYYVLAMALVQGLATSITGSAQLK